MVRELPQKTDTLILKGRGGVDLSGGEIQKLALARALYKDAPVVILDEPTAALDPVSEAAVYESFGQMVKDKTSIYISHRMSSCRFCDDILVFEEGGIVERGSHEALLARAGEYARLWEAQAKYYV
ncbi:lipid A export ATP-binding/permease protein MsbA [Lachnospiraceae bacterium]|nr:lipid A export ATP-binding/permease protein MsbA [Lachnospiraceae bacterium]